MIRLKNGSQHYIGCNSVLENGAYPQYVGEARKQLRACVENEIPGMKEVVEKRAKGYR